MEITKNAIASPQYLKKDRKDYERYQQLYPGLLIHFYVRWDVLERSNRKVPFLHGVCQTDIERIENLIKSGKVLLQAYLKRVNDTMDNAKDNYVLSLENLELVRLLS